MIIFYDSTIDFDRSLNVNQFKHLSLSFFLIPLVLIHSLESNPEILKDSSTVSLII